MTDALVDITTTSQVVGLVSGRTQQRPSIVDTPRIEVDRRVFVIDTSGASGSTGSCDTTATA
jgi:hypothetical protein